MIRALGLELAGLEFNANLRPSVANITNHNINLHGAWRCFPEGRILIDNSSSRTEKVILGKY